MFFSCAVLTARYCRKAVGLFNEKLKKRLRATNANAEKQTAGPMPRRAKPIYELLSYWKRRSTFWSACAAIDSEVVDSDWRV